jgi:hypothetical protein
MWGGASLITAYLLLERKTRQLIRAELPRSLALRAAITAASSRIAPRCPSRSQRASLLAAAPSANEMPHARGQCPAQLLLGGVASGLRAGNAPAVSLKTNLFDQPYILEEFPL